MKKINALWWLMAVITAICLTLAGCKALDVNQTITTTAPDGTTTTTTTQTTDTGWTIGLDNTTIYLQGPLWQEAENEDE